MRIILSRKGFDSQYGGQASPIMPDGTLLSMPIPVRNERLFFSDLNYNEKTYLEIIKELNPNTKIKDNWTCHLDPDLRENINSLNKQWFPLFGQVGASQGHLENNGIKEGDLFLFFGWFKETNYVKGLLKYKKNAPDLHLIFGYLQIDEKFSDISELPEELKYHPHAQKKFEKYNNNCIYKASKALSFCPFLTGAGSLCFHEDLVLTKREHSRSQWNLPEFFRELKISYHTEKSFKDNYFQSARKGQEFIIEENKNATEWATKIITNGMKAQ